MALPGTPGQRISDLCNGNHISQKQLAEKIGVSASQLSRIVSGETKTVSSDILIGVAKEFKVSTDYILGLSTLSVRKSYDISELGLSEGAVRGLVTGIVDVQILNRLLEHRNFPKLMDLIRIYFQDTAAKGIMARNQLIELATASLSDLMKEHPEHRAEARQDPFIYALSADETSLVIAAPRHAITALLSCCFKCACPPGGNLIFAATPTERITHYTLQAKSCAKGDTPFGNPYFVGKLV